MYNKKAKTIYHGEIEELVQQTTAQQSERIERETEAKKNTHIHWIQMKEKNERMALTKCSQVLVKRRLKSTRFAVARCKVNMAHTKTVLTALKLK